MEGGGDTRMHAYKGDGDTDLNAYPEIGDTFSCWMRGLNGTENMNFTYGAQDKDNKYYVKLNLETGILGLFKYVSGSGQSLSGDWSNSTIQNNTGWFKLEIDWTTDHTHTVTLYQNGSEVTSFSYTEGSSDPQFTATGVGYSVFLSSGDTAQFDYATTSGTSQSTGYHYFKIDDFEGSDLEEYRFDRGKAGARVAHRDGYSGSNRFKSAYAGQFSLEIHNDNTEMTSIPGDGLENYPSAGDTISTYLMPSGGADNLNFSWGVQGHNDRYYVKLDPQSGRMYLFKLKSGNGTTLDSTAVSLSQDTWYWLEVYWNTDGTQTVELYDVEGNVLGVVSGQDSEWSDGGIGFDAYLADDGGTVYFDQVRIGKYDKKKGGWGPIVQPSFDRDTTDSYWELVEDFRFLFSTTGFDKQNPNYYTFTVGTFAQTYDVREGVSLDDVSKTQIAPQLGLERLSHTINITGKDGSDVSDQVELSVNNGKIGYTFFDQGEWENWRDAHLTDESTQRELRKTGADNPQIFNQNGDGDVDWQQAVSVLMGLGGVVLGDPRNKVKGAVATAIGGASIYYDLTSEQKCGYTTTTDTDLDKRTWDPCDQTAPLMLYLATYTLYVPLNTQINIDVVQNVGLTNTVAKNTPTTMEWHPTIQTDGTIDLTQDDYGLK